VICYQLSKAEFAEDLSGRGAELSGGRWNTKGTPLLYTCVSQSLSVLEIAVRLSVIDVPDDLKLITIKVSDSIIRKVDMQQLPHDWQKFPHLRATQVFGDELLNNSKHKAFLIPSAIVPTEYNLIVNPKNVTKKEVELISIDDFYIDKKLFR
jgi:RES domain-containing protein